MKQVEYTINRMNALIVKEPWATMIVTGEKTLELRTMRTKKIGKEIYIAKAGTKTLIGKVTIENCRPLTNDECHLFEYKHKAKGIYPNRTVYGWFLTNPIQFHHPISYIHPRGAQIWVKLDPQTLYSNQATTIPIIAPMNS